MKADGIAGATVGVLLVPQAMAYAQLARLPPVYGMYTSLVPAILYGIFGGSNTMSLGTIALCGLMTGEIIEEFLDDPEGDDWESAVEHALAIAFLSGARVCTPPPPIFLLFF